MIPLDHKGAIDPETVPLIVQDEQMPILDFALNPFDDFSVATSGLLLLNADEIRAPETLPRLTSVFNFLHHIAEDGRAFVWKWPEGNAKHITQPSAVIQGHSKRLLFVDFHPKVEGTLISHL
jgi:hypothetical protein